MSASMMLTINIITCVMVVHLRTLMVCPLLVDGEQLKERRPQVARHHALIHSAVTFL